MTKKYTVRQIIAIRRKIAAKAAGETVAAAPVGKTAKAKRPQTEAQKKAWREQILPKLQAGRARKAAEKAAQAAAGETAQAA